MAGAAREMTDPVDAARHGIGSSRRLIASTLDDLSDHHSWLETYHRDERLRAERLRRRELRERVERRYRSTKATATHAARSAYVGGRRFARLSKRASMAVAVWAARRLLKLARQTAETTSVAWRRSRLHARVFVRQASTAVRDGFNWSVQASEHAGIILRQRVSEASAKVAGELQRQTAPVRRYGRCASVRAWRSALRARDAAAQRVTTAALESQMLAQVRRTLHRRTIRARHRVAPSIRQAHAAAIRMEAELSARILQTLPAFRRVLRAHMPKAGIPVKRGLSATGRALIPRPTTALACIDRRRARLPVPYHA